MMFSPIISMACRSFKLDLIVKPGLNYVHRMYKSTREAKKIKHCRHSAINYTFNCVLYATMITKNASTAKLKPSSAAIICKLRVKSCMSLTLAAVINQRQWKHSAANMNDTIEIAMDDTWS